MHTEAPFSFTLKVSGDLFSIRGNDFFEFVSNLDKATDAIGSIRTLQTAASGATQSLSEAAVMQSLQSAGFSPQIVSEPAEQAPQTQTYGGPTEKTDKWGNKYLAGVPDTGFCSHGPRVKATKTSSKGTVYTAFVCVNDSPFGDYKQGKCDQVYPPKK